MKKTDNLVCICAIAFCIGLAIFFGARKQGFYIDELWSYGLANSYYEPFLQDYEGYYEEDQNGDFFKSYLVVDKEHRFNYASVAYNQAGDVHPPFYYCLLHTISSLFPGEFSKWFGIGLNLLAYALELVFILKLAQMMHGDNIIYQLFTLLFVGLSPLILSMVTYVRMYMLLLLMCTLFFYVTEKINETSQKKYYIALIFVATLGMLTHYYFLIAACVFGGLNFLYFVFSKRTKEGLAYLASCLLGGGISVGIFPAMLHHMFGGYKSQESISSAISFSVSDYISKANGFLKIWANELGIPKIILLVVGLSFGIFFVWRFIVKRKTDSFLVYALPFSGIILFLGISQVAVEVTDRYIAPAMICLLLACSYMLLTGIKAIKKPLGKYIAYTIILAAIVFFLVFGNVNYIYQGYGDALKFVKEKKNAEVIYITKGDHLVINNILFFMEADKVHTIPVEDLEHLQREYGEVLLYVDIYYDRDETAKLFAKKQGLENVEFVYDNEFTSLYYLK